MTRRRAASRLVVRVAAACVLLLAWPVLRPLEAQENWAGKLGYGNNRKVFIIHADDAGSFAGANSGIQTLLETPDSVMQSTALMVPAKYYKDFVGWHNTHPGHDVGLHLTLNSEWRPYRWPPAFRPPGDVKHILESKFLCWGWKPLLPRKAGPYLLCRAPASVAREQAAQIRIATEGLNDPGGPPPQLIPAMVPKPSHLDTHMGTAYVRESHFERYLLAARIYGIPAATFQNFDETVECMDQDLNPDPALHSFLRIIVRHLLKLQHQQEGFEKTYGWPFPRVDRICAIPYGSDLAQTKQNFKQKVNQKIGAGITQFLFHPSDDDEELKNASSETANVRINIDRHLFAGSAGTTCTPDPADLPTFLTCTGTVVNWRKLQKRYDHIVRDHNCSAPPGDNDPYDHPVDCP